MTTGQEALTSSDWQFPAVNKHGEPVAAAASPVMGYVAMTSPISASSPPMPVATAPPMDAVAAPVVMGVVANVDMDTTVEYATVRVGVDDGDTTTAEALREAHDSQATQEQEAITEAPPTAMQWATNFMSSFGANVRTLWGETSSATARSVLALGVVLATPVAMAITVLLGVAGAVRAGSAYVMDTRRPVLCIVPSLQKRRSHVATLSQWLVLPS